MAPGSWLSDLPGLKHRPILLVRAEDNTCRILTHNSFAYSDVENGSILYHCKSYIFVGILTAILQHLVFTVLEYSCILYLGVL